MKNMAKLNDQQKAFKHYRLAIIDSKLCYTLFKTLFFSRSEVIVGREMQEKYLWTQKQYGGFFTLVEHNAVIAFIIKILHCFDYKENDDRPLTLRDLDRKSYDVFVNEENNLTVIKKLKYLRDKRIAHHDKTDNVIMELPSFIVLDDFFKRIEIFFDKLDSLFNDTKTLREQDQDLKNDIEKILRNLYVGENFRLLNNKMRYLWDENPQKISKK